MNFPGKYVIFSIDFQDDPAVYNRFLNRMHHHPDRVNNIIPCIGSWMGVQERSFIMEAYDFINCVDADDLASQDAILFVSECNKQYCTLVFQDENAPHEYIGSMREVTEAEAKAEQGWTYRPDNARWFITRKDNLDRVPCGA